jgi:hypothetical protein
VAQVALPLRDRREQDQPVVVPVVVRAGGEQPVLRGEPEVVTGRSEVPVGEAAEPVRDEQTGGGRPGQRLPDRLDP